MRRIKKRLSTLTLCVLLICLLTATVWASAPTLNCPGNCTHQAAIGTTHYDTVADAMAAAIENNTVKLLQDLTATESILVDKAITLDANGKTVTGDTALEQPLLTITAPCTLRGGTLTAAGTVVLLQDSTLTLDKDAVLAGTGTVPTLLALSEEEACRILVQENAQILSQEATSLEMNGSAQLEITGGTIAAKGNTLRLRFTKPQTLKLTVSGGTITTEEGKLFDMQALEGAKIPSGFITGGTFSRSPSLYVASGYRSLKNTDGTYTVVKVHTVSFTANGGKGKMTAKQVAEGKTLILPKCGFTAPGGKDFAGWSVNGKTYAPGDKIEITEDTTVKALWKAHVHTGGKATCQSKAKCSTCGKAYGSTGNHTLKKISGYAATCTEGGRIAHSKCTICGKRFAGGVKISAKSVSTPSLGHDWVDHEGKEPTCQEAGKRAYRECDRCGKLLADGKKISKKDLTLPVADHTLETIEAVAATCTQPGTQAHQRCTQCDRIFFNNAEAEADALTIATIPHLMSDWVSDETAHWKNCVECGAEFRRHTHKDADQSGSCDECDYAMPVVEVITPPSKEETPSEPSVPYLIPVAAAAVIAVALAVFLVIKKRKQA